MAVTTERCLILLSILVELLFLPSLGTVIFSLRALNYKKDNTIIHQPAVTLNQLNS